MLSNDQIDTYKALHLTSAEYTFFSRYTEHVPRENIF